MRRSAIIAATLIASVSVSVSVASAATAGARPAGAIAKQATPVLSTVESPGADRLPRSAPDRSSTALPETDSIQAETCNWITGWYQQSSYAGFWPINNTWWERQCKYSSVRFGVHSSTFQFYYWDGAKPVYYGEWWYASAGDCCNQGDLWWWDAADQRWYGPYRL